jgi:HlyD family secretion protein
MRISLPFPRGRERAGAKQPSLAQQRWLALPVLLAVIAGVVFWLLPARLAPVTPTTTATVSQGSLTTNVSGSGSVAAARSVDLSFQQSSTITAVNVAVGDTVKTGQTLATIDTSDLKLALQQAQANLKSAQASYDQTKRGTATASDLASAQAALDSAKAQFAKTKTGTVTDVQSAQANLVSAQAKLDALKNPTQADVSAAQSKVDQARTSLQSTQNSASQAKTNAQLALQNSVNALTQTQSKFATAQENWQHVQDTGTDPNQPSTTDATGKKKPNKLNDAQRQSFYDAFVQAQASLDSAQNAVTQAQVAFDAARQKEVTDNDQAQAAVQDAQATLDALLHPNANDLAQAQAAVTQAQTQLTSLQKGGTLASLASAQAQVTQAQAGLDKLTAPATDADLASAEAGVLQAQVNVDTAQNNLDKATLVAPFDGVVSAVGLQVGSTTGSNISSGTTGSSSSSTGSSSSSSSITLVDRSQLHINVNLSETDAAKVAIGQPVTLTFDAVPDVTLTGKVATIAPSATTSQNVVTYPVQINFDVGKAPIKIGMSATADIQTQKIDNAILVPSRAVQTVGNSKAVTVLQGNQRLPVAVEVETGATSNGQTEILSCVSTGAQCLRAGDLLSIPTATTTTTTQAGNNRGFGGGFGGGGGFRIPAGGPRGD